MRGIMVFLADCLAFLCVATPAWSVPPNDTPRSWDAVVHEPDGAGLTYACDAAINKLELQGYLVTERRQANWTFPATVTLATWNHDFYVGYGVWVDNTHGNVQGFGAEAYPLTNQGLVARNNAMVAYGAAGIDTLNEIYAAQSADSYLIVVCAVYIAEHFYSWRTEVVLGACDAAAYSQSWKNARCVEAYPGEVTTSKARQDFDSFFSHQNGDFGVDLRTADKADDQTGFSLYGAGNTVLSPRIISDDVPTTLTQRLHGVQINFDTPIDTEIPVTTSLANRSSNLEIYPYYYTDGIGFTLIGRATGTGMLEAVAGDILNFKDGIQSTGHIGLDANGQGPNRDGKLYVINNTYVDTDPAGLISHYEVTHDAADVVVSWNASQEQRTREYRIEHSLDWFAPRDLVTTVAPGPGVYRVVVPNGADGIYWLREVETDGTLLDHDANPVSQPVQAVPDSVTVTDFAVGDSLLQSAERSHALRTQATTTPQLKIIFTVKKFTCPANWYRDFWIAYGTPTQVVLLEDIGGTEGIKPYIASHAGITSVLFYGGPSVLKDVHGVDVWNDATQWNTMNYGPKPTTPQNPNNAVIGWWYTVDPDSQQVGFPCWTRRWGSVLPYTDLNNNGKPDDGIRFGVAPIADTTDAWGFNYKMAYAKNMQPSSTVSFWGYFRGGTNAGWNYSMALQDSLKRRLPRNVTSVTLRDWFLAPMSTEQRTTAAVNEMDSDHDVIVTNSIYDSWRSFGSFLQQDQSFTMARLRSNPTHPKAVVSQCGNGAVDLTDSLGTVLSRLMINTPDKGAYLIWAPTRGSFAQANFALQDTAFALLYKNANSPYPVPDQPFGDITNASSCSVIDAYPAYADVVRSYVLLGDPDLAIKVPGPSTVSVPPTTPSIDFSVMPNPVSSGRATVHFALPAVCNVDCSVFDLAGRRVANLMNGTQQSGTYALTWHPGSLPAGLYLVRLQSPYATATAKVFRLQ